MRFLLKLIIEVILVFLTESVKVGPDKCFDLLQLMTSNDVLALDLCDLFTFVKFI